MGTPFSDIYQLFLSQIKVFDIAEVFSKAKKAYESGIPEEIALADASIKDIESNMQYWLMSSIGHFGNCTKDLRKPDLILAQFNDELSFEEQNILAKYMAFSYILTHVITETNLKQSLNSKDYRMYSPANQLKALQGLRDSLYSEANSLKTQYSYNIHSVKEFFK